MISRILSSVEARFYQKINSLLIKKREAVEKAIPQVDLQAINIKNAKVLVDRSALLELMPKNAVVAEIGVFKGEFSHKILEITKPKKFHLIDAWSDPNYPVSLMNALTDKYGKQISEGVVEINRGWSTDVVNQFEDNYFDWIYLDSDHSYSMTILELEKYKSKMKKNGIIAGHDFVQGAFKYGIRFGVIEAVSEFCVRHNWEIIYLTMDYPSYPSFAIRAID